MLFRAKTEYHAAAPRARSLNSCQFHPTLLKQLVSSSAAAAAAAAAAMHPRSPPQSPSHPLGVALFSTRCCRLLCIRPVRVARLTNAE
jgi:hypothetical protein